MSKEKSFIYLLEITVGAKNISALVKNILPVPEEILETMSKEIINTYINDSYKEGKMWRTQTSESYYNRMTKQSSFEVKDINQLDVYDLQLKFTENKISNNGEKVEDKRKIS